MSTLGYEKKFNWAFQIKEEKQFLDELLAGQPEPPKYFAQMKKLNKIGPELLKKEQTPKTTLPLNNGAILVDTRPAAEFERGHVEGSLNLPYNGSFTNWAGWLIDYEQDIVLLVNEEENLVNVKKSLQSIGLDRVTGYILTENIGQELEEGYETISADEAKQLLDKEDTYLIDVRNQNEWDEGHIPGAHHHMLGNLEDQLDEISKDKKIITHCQAGARSAIGTSLLQAKGFKNVFNLEGGFSAWEKEGLPVKKD